MSVRTLKQTQDVQWPAEQVDGLPAALTQLHHWAKITPLQGALRHQRDDHWYAWRWIDVLRDVERLADGLRQQGFTGQSRLVLSGAFEPRMLLLALAAQSIGGRVLTLADDLGPDLLHRQLWRIRPTHAYVPQRLALGSWLAVAGSSVAPRWLFSEQAACGSAVLAFDQLLGPQESAQQPCRWWHALEKSPLWCEESTRWEGGLAAVLQQWLGSGQSLAFAQHG